jgi:Cu/Zn superoxide dismutase
MPSLREIDAMPDAAVGIHVHTNPSCPASRAGTRIRRTFEAP